MRKIRRLPEAKFETEIDLGDRTVPLVARVNRRAKRLIVKVDSLEGRVVVTAPSKRALPEALRFAGERSSWIRARLDEGAPARPFVDGGLCPYRGVMHAIRCEGSPRLLARVVTEGTPVIRVGGDPAHVNRRLVDWLKSEARAALTERAQAHSAQLGKNFSRISIRDSRSRWGSCSRDGVLSFSWRLILAPPYILDYVAAHECAHLVHLNHSPAYWRALLSLGVDENAARAWFEENGEALHAWGATPPVWRRAA
ncbi:MAG: SprT family zinc-dependent metalloprotease [Parvularculaceae bacterium]